MKEILRHSSGKQVNILYTKSSSLKAQAITTRSDDRVYFFVYFRGLVLYPSYSTIFILLYSKETQMDVRRPANRFVSIYVW
jgi:hypothetical protein